MNYYVISLLAVLLASFSQIMLKSSSRVLYNSRLREYFNVKVLCGYALMTLAFFGNIYAMHSGLQIKEMSIIESLSYLFVPLLSHFTFKEKFTKKKMISILLIMLGVSVFFTKI